MKHIETAIIPVAGWGTRRLPITKAIEKCMLPIHDRPTVDFVVEDCAAAGIKHIIFVVGEESSQLQTYYGHHQKLEQYLEERGKTEELAVVNATGRGLRFSYVVQPQDGAYGTAVPVQLAAEKLQGEEYFAVMMGDDFVYRDDGGSELRDAVEAFQDSSADHLMLSAEVPRDQASHYGVLKVDAGGMLQEILEKPPLEKVPVPAQINISKFIFSDKLLKHLDDYMAETLSEGQEYRLTDVVLRSVAAGEKLQVRPIRGQYLDVGNADAWLAANNAVASGKLS